MGTFLELYRKNKSVYSAALIPFYSNKPLHYSDKFFRMVNKKRIVISGPSGNDPLPLYDNLAGFNWQNSPITYSNCEFSKDTIYEPGVFYVFKTAPHPIQKTMIAKGNAKLVAYKIKQIPIGKPNGLQIAVNDLLSYKAKVYITNVNFFLGNYNKDYKGIDKPPKWSLIGHDALMNFRFMQILYRYKMIEVSGKVSKILEMPVSEYAIKLDDIYKE